MEEPRRLDVLNQWDSVKKHLVLDVSKRLATNAGCPKSDPRTLIPCSSSGSPGPFHTVGSAILANLSSTSHTGGLNPA